MQTSQPQNQSQDHRTLPLSQDATVRDAARYRWLRDKGLRYANVGLGSDADGNNVVDFSPTFTIPEPTGMSYENNEWSLDDLDAAIDASIAKRLHELACQIGFANSLGVRAEVCSDAAQREQAARLYREAMAELARLECRPGATS